MALFSLIFPRARWIFNLDSQIFFQFMTLFFNIRYYHFLSSVLLFSIIQLLLKIKKLFPPHWSHFLSCFFSDFSTASKRLSSLDSTTLFQSDSSLLRVIIVGFHFFYYTLSFQKSILGWFISQFNLMVFLFLHFLTLMTCSYFKME